MAGSGRAKVIGERAGSERSKVIGEGHDSSEDRQGNINRKLPEAVCVQDGGMKDLKAMCKRLSCSPDDGVVLKADHVSVRQGLGT
jgi:hypothetical protein